MYSMRSLEECKVEIFRRSEEKIKKRKQQRTRILAICLPLCLCVGALALWGMGQDDSVVNKSDAPPKNGFGLLPKAEAAPESVLPNENFIIADSSAAISQYDYVQLLLEDAADMEHPDSQLKDAPTAAPFHFTLCAPDGTVVPYALTGNVLCEEESGRSVTLTDTQLWELKRILGIQEVAE